MQGIPVQSAPIRATAASLAVTRHELRELLYAPLTYLFLVGFLLALSACVFLVGDFYATDDASIRLLIVFAPWVALIFVPALAMRAWVEAPGNRAIELSMTLPLAVSAVVTGKFLAGSLVLMVAVAFTAPFALTVVYLGEPDLGKLAAGYFGATLLLGSFYAIALLGASFSRDQVGAFVIAVGGLFVLVMFGWDAFTRLLEGALPGPVLEMLARYSPRTWLEEFESGLVALDGVLYLVVLAAIALVGTGANLSARRRGLDAVGGLLQRCAVLFAVLAAVAVTLPIVSLVDIELDATKEREFTLHEGTRNVLSDVPSQIEVTLYWSAAQAAVPVAIKTHARRVRRLLESMSTASQGRLIVKEVDPEPDTDSELRARVDGLRRVPMSSGDHFYLGAVFRRGDRVHAIPYFDIRRERQAEYDMAVAVKSLGLDRTSKVGVLSPLLPSTAAIEGREGFAFLDELKRAYDIAVIPFFDDSLPDGLDVLVVVDASILKKEMLQAIDQFVMQGGSLVVMMDPHVRFNRASNQVRPQPSAEVNDISDLLLAYGVRYLGEAVVGDASLASPVADQTGGTMSFPFWLRVSQAQLSDGHPVTAGLNELLLVEPGAFEWDADTPAHPLVTTSERSGVLGRGAFSSATPRDLALGFASDGRARVVAVAIRGPVSSAFSPGSGPSRRSPSDASIFAVADVDWLFDPFSLQTVELGGQIIARPLNDNLALLLNLVEYASGAPDLLAIRSRGRLARPFNRVADLFVEAQSRYRAEETRLAERIASAEADFAERAGAAGVSSIDDLPPELANDARRLAAELLPLRKQLRDIRRQIREEVERLGLVLVVVNLLAGPALVLAFAVLVWMRRKAVLRRWSRH